MSIRIYEWLGGWKRLELASVIEAIEACVQVLYSLHSGGFPGFRATQ